MKSERQIPNLIFNRLGSSIVSVTSLNGETTFNPITLKAYQLSKTRTTSKLFKKHYYYLQDGYLFIPDSEVEYVTITYIPFDESDTDGASNCTETSCGCKSIWDYQFMVPDKLSEQVIQETIKEVSLRRQVQVDENPNLNSNEK